MENMGIMENMENTEIMDYVDVPVYLENHKYQFCAMLAVDDEGFQTDDAVDSGAMWH